jgi:TonB-linked SusC/RagA family outer membrane protein
VPASARAGSATVDVTASLIGYTTEVQTVTLQAGTQVLNFVLGEDPLRIAGVTVTALGMERQSRELGISTETVAGADLSRVEPNLVNTLSGKVAGVNITNSGPQGGSSRIVIRGENSLTGSNQPLFIVDGVPVDNSIAGRVGTLTDQGGYDYGNPIQDINPADIESLTVLKGPNAAALYGSRASNGAIIIETKKGAATPGGAEIVVSQQVTMENVLRLPDYQNVYGQGYAGEYAYFDGNGNGINDEADESWGPPLDVGLMIPQWDSPYDPSLPGCNPAGTTTERIACREAQPWVSSPDNVRDFFETGVTSVTNVSVAGSNEAMNGRASYSRMDLGGMQPGHQLDRNAFSFAGGIRAFDALQINSSVQYISSRGQNRPSVGYTPTNVMQGFVWFGRQVDTNRLKELYTETRPLNEPTVGGFPYNWETLYHVNPYFKAYEWGNEDTRDRLLGQISASYDVNDWLNVMVRTGTDWYQDERLKSFNANPAVSISGDYTTNPVTGTGREYISPDGSFGRWNIGFQETNTDFLVAANPDLGLPFTTALTVGGNRRDYERKQDYTWVQRLTAPGIWDVSNAATTPERTTAVAQKQVYSLYGQLDLGYNDYLFLTATGRNDWSSTLPVDNRSYFYPSVSASFVFSEVVDALQDSPISYGKIRASWAQVGNDTDPYRLRNTYLAGDLWGTNPTFSVSGRLENNELKPELTESLEFGAELGFLDNRLGLDVTYYTEETRDQIMPVQLSATTGYTSQMLNAGTVSNKGWEVLVRGTPVATSSFRWESTLTWSKNDSEVVDLAPGVSALEITQRDWWGAQLYARKGEPLGQLVGSDFRRDPDGNIIVSASAGVPLWDDNQVIGNVNPDWRAGLSNEFSYGGARLSVLFDMRQGGQVYSVTNAFGRLAGILEETVDGRCGGGYPACDATTGIVYPGVNQVVTGTDTTYVENTTVVDAETLWLYNYFVEASNLEDASYIKLREVTLSYSLPDSWIGRWGVDAVDVSLVGRNLALWTDARHIDPETSLEATNVQGFEFGQMPSARSFGINVTVRP